MDEFKFFIIPRGRTGGTLLATMLNAHPRVSMGYEIYPDLLQRTDGAAYTPAELIDRLEASRSDDNESWVKALSRDGFRTFAARARRSGIEPQLLLDALSAFAAEGRTLERLDQKLDLIDNLLRRQGEQAGKPYLGSKMRVEPEVLFARHPSAVYLMMLRDGRDVLDSRMKVGNFRTSPADCAREWRDDLLGFEAFLASSGARGCLVAYEQLVSDPESVLRPIMALAELEFDPLMVDFVKAEQSLFDNAHGHLSARQLSAGLSDASVGRWRDGLDAEQLRAFTEVAGDTLLHYGYK